MNKYLPFSLCANILGDNLQSTAVLTFLHCLFVSQRLLTSSPAGICNLHKLYIFFAKCRETWNAYTFSSIFVKSQNADSCSTDVQCAQHLVIHVRCCEYRDRLAQILHIHHFASGGSCCWAVLQYGCPNIWIVGVE